MALAALGATQQNASRWMDRVGAEDSERMAQIGYSVAESASTRDSKSLEPKFRPASPVATTMILTTKPRTAAECERVQSILDRGLADFPPDYRSAFQELLATYVLREAVVPSLTTTASDAFERLDVAEKDSVYWEEIDGIVQCIRAYVFRHTAWRVLACFETNDVASRASNARLLIELAIWSSYFQYGLTTAHNYLRRNLDSIEGIMVLCPDLENFVRGAVAVGQSRITAAAASIGANVPDEPPNGYVDEFVVSFAKQVSTVRAVADRIKSEVNVPELPEVVDRLHNAYRFCCSLTHVTPVLLQVAEDPARVDAETVRYFLNAVCLSLRLQHELFFHHRFGDLSFSRLIGGRPRKDTRRLAEVPVEFLRQMQQKNSQLAVDLAGGSSIRFY